MEVKPGVYRHYKGNLYEVIGVGKHSETLEELVVYRAIHEKDGVCGDIWIRPVSMFIESVEVGGKMVPRFSFLKDDLYDGAV